jgi:hypothetical protein
MGCFALSWKSASLKEHSAKVVQYGFTHRDMSLLDACILTIYFALLLALAGFGLHRYLMVYLYCRYRNRRPAPVGEPASYPAVTVQLPLFNYVGLMSLFQGRGWSGRISALLHWREAPGSRPVDRPLPALVDSVAAWPQPARLDSPRGPQID